MIVISSTAVLTTNRFGPASQCGRNCCGNKTRQKTWINLPNAKVLPQQSRIVYFLAVASRWCDMQPPPKKLSGEALSNSLQSAHARAR